VVEAVNSPRVKLRNSVPLHFLRTVQNDMLDFGGRGIHAPHSLGHDTNLPPAAERQGVACGHPPLSIRPLNRAKSDVSSPMFQVDILPRRAHTRVICLPKKPEND
jgi:hypothetical protein